MLNLHIACLALVYRINKHTNGDDREESATTSVFVCM